MGTSGALAGLGILTIVTGCSGEDDPCTGTDNHEPICLQCRGDEDPFSGAKLGEDEQLQIEIVTSEPAGHLVGNNQLQVRVSNPAGQPMADAMLTKIEPFAPRQGHGTPIVPEVTPVADGVFDVTSINYVHRGPWELRFDVTAGGTSDRVVFVFCVND